MQDYLEKPKKKKKKEDCSSKGKPFRNFQIIDDDISINDLKTSQENEILVDLLDPEGPSIVYDVIPEEKPKNNSKNKWIKFDDFDGQETEDQEELNSKNLFKKRTVKPSKTNHHDDLDEIPRKNKDHESDLVRRIIESREDDDDLDMILRRRKSAEDLSAVRPKQKSHEDSDQDLDYIPRIKKEKTSPDRTKSIKHKDENAEIDETKVRIRKTTKEEELKKKKESALKAKYDDWKMGLAQKKEKEEKITNFLYESEKPLARYADDKDLDSMLKNQEREDDPMLAYLKKNNPVDKKEDGKPKPKYRGPPAQPNRYNILPGSKWDGVDRSNGFEKKFFESINAKKVFEQEAYKWSTEDM